MGKKILNYAIMIALYITILVGFVFLMILLEMIFNIRLGLIPKYATLIIAIGTARALKSPVKKLFRIDNETLTRIEREKYEQNYPISADKLPFCHLATGDILSLKGYGECIYDKKYPFSKKHTVWIIRENEEGNLMKEFTDQELSELTQRVSCEFGLKWSNNSNTNER